MASIKARKGLHLLDRFQFNVFFHRAKPFLNRSVGNGRPDVGYPHGSMPSILKPMQAKRACHMEGTYP